MKVLAIIILVISLSACVSIEMPKHMVADTVEAGKDAYKGIRGDKNKIKGFLFSYTYLGKDTESDGVLISSCFKELEIDAKLKLGVLNVNYDVVSNDITKVNGKSIVNCSIDVMKTN